MKEITKYFAKNEFYQNGVIRINFFYSLEETAPLHTHDFFEIFLVTEGTARHFINGTECKISKNDLVFIRPKDIHKYFAYEGQPFKMVNLSFSNENIDAIQSFFEPLTDIADFLAAPMPFFVRLSDYQKNYFIKQLLNFCYTKGMDNHKLQLAVRKLIMELFYTYYLPTNKQQYILPSTNVPDWFNEFYIMLDSKDYFTRSPAEIINAIGRNPQYVMRMFKQITGVNLTEHLNRKRLDFAYTLLLHSDMKITDIAFECGYESLSTFYHAFQRYFHFTPKSVRLGREENTLKF